MQSDWQSKLSYPWHCGRGHGNMTPSHPFSSKKTCHERLPAFQRHSAGSSGDCARCPSGAVAKNLPKQEGVPAAVAAMQHPNRRSSTKSSRNAVSKTLGHGRGSPSPLTLFLFEKGYINMKQSAQNRLGKGRSPTPLRYPSECGDMLICNAMYAKPTMIEVPRPLQSQDGNQPAAA